MQVRNEIADFLQNPQNIQTHDLITIFGNSNRTEYNDYISKVRTHGEWAVGELALIVRALYNVNVDVRCPNANPLIYSVDNTLETYRIAHIFNQHFRVIVIDN